MINDNENGRSLKRVNRCKWEIIRDILKVVNEDCSTKTRIQHKANIDWRCFQKYFGSMLDKGFISIADNSSDNSSIYYEITDEGKKLFEQLNNTDIEIKKV